MTDECVPTPGDSATLVGPVPPLRRLRRLKGWTQAQLAQAAGVTSSTIVYLERGDREPHPGTMARIARALGVRITDIDEFVDPPKDEQRPGGEPGAN